MMNRWSNQKLIAWIYLSLEQEQANNVAHWNYCRLYQNTPLNSSQVNIYLLLMLFTNIQQSFHLSLLLHYQPIHFRKGILNLLYLTNILRCLLSSTFWWFHEFIRKEDLDLSIIALKSKCIGVMLQGVIYVEDTQPLLSVAPVRSIIS